jgi:hypothetical protein
MQNEVGGQHCPRTEAESELRLAKWIMEALNLQCRLVLLPDDPRFPPGDDETVCSIQGSRVDFLKVSRYLHAKLKGVL